MIIPTQNSLKQRKNFQKRFVAGGSAISLVESISSLDELHSFFASKVLINAKMDERLASLEKIKEKFNTVRVSQSVEFLQYAFNLAEERLFDAKHHAKALSADDLMLYIENAITQIDNRRVAPDGNSYPDKILNSMRAHIVENIGNSLDFIRKYKIRFTGQTTKRNRKHASVAFTALSNFHSIMYSIVEVLNGNYIAIDVAENNKIDYTNKSSLSNEKSFRYFLARNPPAWSKIEIYRDLNYSFMDFRFNNTDAFSASGFHRHDKSIDCLRIDFSKGAELEVELNFDTVSNLLRDIYGATDCLFLVEGNEYRIDQLIFVAKKIAMLRVSIFNKRNEQQHQTYNKRVHRFGQGSLLRALDLASEYLPLLQLFVFDADSIHRPISAEFLPLFKSGQVYYLMPSLIDAMCYEKVIDKILSRRDITVKTSGKGYAFESTILNVLISSQYTHGTVKRDEASGVPEIDGLISLEGEVVVVYEAKCSVKPESRSDASSFIENHLEKAIRQLTERISFIRSHPDEVASRVGFSIANKLLVPIVITNHSYFTGLTQNIENSPIFIIDIELFKDMFVKKIVPTWEYSPETDQYFRSELPIRSTSELVAILSDLPSLLRSASRATIVVNDFGIGYEISNTPQIDYFPENRFSLS